MALRDKMFHLDDRRASNLVLVTPYPYDQRVFNCPIFMLKADRSLWRWSEGDKSYVKLMGFEIHPDWVTTLTSTEGELLYHYKEM